MPLVKCVGNVLTGVQSGLIMFLAYCSGRVLQSEGTGDYDGSNDCLTFYSDGGDW